MTLTIKKSLPFFCALSFVFFSMTCHAFYAKATTSPAAKGQYPTYPQINYGKEPDASVIKRGEYLAKVGDCIACHTDTTKNGVPFAGDLPMNTPFGVFYTPNITPDKETGLGNWDVEDFIRAMREGKRADGANLFPVFPYLYYSKISDDDLRAIWAYLQKLPAVKNTPRKNEVPFPFSWRFAQYGWKLLFFYFHTGQYQYNAAETAEWNRGAYLVQGLGHCGMCHTPMNLLGGPRNKYFLTGAFIDGFWAPDITRTGLARVSVADVVKVFQVAELPKKAGRVVGPMAEVDHNSLVYLKDDDLKAIAVYLKSVKSTERLGITGVTAPPTLERGKKVYNSACITCHEDGKEGAPILEDAANWNTRVKQGTLTLYRHTIDGYNLMPMRGACATCSDEDITAAVDYMVHTSLTPAQWKEYQNPKPEQQQAPEVTGKEIYQQYCSVCHDNGKFGAPKLDQKEVWQHIMDTKTMDELITYVIKGSDKKPPKGGCKYCNTADIISAIKYMVKESKVTGDYDLW